MFKIMSEKEVSHIPGGYLESLTEWISEIGTKNKMGFFSYFDHINDGEYHHTSFYHDYEQCHHDRVWSG